MSHWRKNPTLVLTVCKVMQGLSGQDALAGLYMPHVNAWVQGLCRCGGDVFRMRALFAKILIFCIFWPTLRQNYTDLTTHGEPLESAIARLGRDLSNGVLLKAF